MSWRNRVEFSGRAIHPRSFPVLRQLFTDPIIAPEVRQCWSLDVVPVDPS